MIQSVPPITSATISVPKASASELFTLSGAVVRWRKKARCTPICATARTLSATGMLGRPQPIGAREVKGESRQQRGKDEAQKIALRAA